MKFFFIIIIFIAVSPLVKSQNLIFEDSDEEIIVNAKGKTSNTLTFDSVRVEKFLFGTKKMEILGNHLVVIGHRKDSIFMMFSLDNFSYEGSFGLIGKGPNEFNNPVYNGFNCYHNSIVATDLSTIKVFGLSMKYDDLNPVVLRTIRIPGILFPLNNSILLNDTIVLGTKITSLKEVSYFNTATGDLGETLNYPGLMKNVPQNAKGRIYSKVIDVSNDNSTLVFAYQLFPHIRIIDLPTGGRKDLLVNTKYKQIKKKIGNNRNIGYQHMITFYESISVSDNHFVTLLKNQVFEEVKGNEIQLKQIKAPELHVFSIGGQLLKRYNVPSWMKIMVIDEDRGRIITFNPEQDEYIFFANLYFK